MENNKNDLESERLELEIKAYNKQINAFFKYINDSDIMYDWEHIMGKRGYVEELNVLKNEHKKIEKNHVKGDVLKEKTEKENLKKLKGKINKLHQTIIEKDMPNTENSPEQPDESLSILRKEIKEYKKQISEYFDYFKSGFMEEWKTYAGKRGFVEECEKLKNMYDQVTSIGYLAKYGLVTLKNDLKDFKKVIYKFHLKVIEKDMAGPENTLEEPTGTQPTVE